jgi:ABC-type proline/glycine betaine transport system permease subunit
MRSNPAAHKRLILAATTALLIAAISRWPVAFVQRRPPEAALVTYVFLLMMVGYDLWSTRKVHRATIWASAFLIIVQRVAFPFGHTAAWHAFATWAQGIGH